MRQLRSFKEAKMRLLDYAEIAWENHPESWRDEDHFNQWREGIIESPITANGILELILKRNGEELWDEGCYWILQEAYGLYETDWGEEWISLDEYFKRMRLTRGKINCLSGSILSRSSSNGV